MLRNLFEFDQHDTQRIKLPRHAVSVLDLNREPSENRRIALESGHSRFPLINSADGNRVIGVVLIKSIYRVILEGGAGKGDPWDDLQKYCNKALLVSESQKIATLFELMREQRNHMALVVEEYGQLSGIVTLEDLLEEIVGDIEDESDSDTGKVFFKQIDDQAWEVDGMMNLGQLERLLEFEIIEAVDANSVSGLFMERLERLPAEGDQIEENGYVFRVIEINGSRVGLVAITKMALTDDARQEIDSAGTDDSSSSA